MIKCKKPRDADMRLGTFDQDIQSLQSFVQDLSLLRIFSLDKIYYNINNEIISIYLDWDFYQGEKEFLVYYFQGCLDMWKLLVE